MWYNNSTTFFYNNLVISALMISTLSIPFGIFLFLYLHNKILYLLKTQADITEILLCRYLNADISSCRKCVVTLIRPRFYAWYWIDTTHFLIVRKYRRKRDFNNEHLKSKHKTNHAVIVRYCVTVFMLIGRSETGRDIKEHAIARCFYTSSGSNRKTRDCHTTTLRHIKRNDLYPEHEHKKLHAMQTLRSLNRMRYNPSI